VVPDLKQDYVSFFDIVKTSISMLCIYNYRIHDEGIEEESTFGSPQQAPS
jgi:hypothetical protein